MGVAVRLNMSPSKKQIEDIRDGLEKRLRAAGDTWLPAHPRLFGVPPIAPDEAASSWIWRVTAKTRIPAAMLLKAWRLTVPVFWLDGGAEPLEIDAIAAMTMQPTDSLRHLLWPHASVLKEIEFACLTTEPVAQRPIYRYCAPCLRGDKVPYFRQTWRLACSYVCERHGAILRDACPQCSARVDLGRVRRRMQVPSLRHCLACGADMTAGEMQGFPEEVLASVFALQAQLQGWLYGSVAPPAMPLSVGWPGETLHRIGARVDVHRADNVLALLGRVLRPHLPAPAAMTPGQCRERLGQYLRRLVWRQVNGKDIHVAVGLDGQRLFGKHAGLVGSYVMTCQSLAGGTYWWPNSGVWPVRRLNEFERSDIGAAARWVDARGQSKPDAVP